MTNAQAAVLASAHAINFNITKGLQQARQVKEWLDQQDELDARDARIAQAEEGSR